MIEVSTSDCERIVRNVMQIADVRGGSLREQEAKRQLKLIAKKLQRKIERQQWQKTDS